MRRTLSSAALIVVLSVVAMAPASAEGVSDNTPGHNADLLILYYRFVEPTGSPSSEDGLVTNLGGAISGGYYGNTSNSGADSDAPDNGHGVTASLAPGPSKGGCAGVTEGASIGYAITGNGPAAVGHAYDPDC